MGLRIAVPPNKLRYARPKTCQNRAKHKHNMFIYKKKTWLPHHPFPGSGFPASLFVGQAVSLHLQLPQMPPSLLAPKAESTQKYCKACCVSCLAHLPIPSDKADTVSRVDTVVRERADLRLDDHGSSEDEGVGPAVPATS